MTVTIVVATRNRRERLAQTLPRHEWPVVVVDNGSSDGSAEVAASGGALVVPLLENLGAAARNLGAAAAETEFVAFADDDSFWAPGSLRRAVELLAEYPRAALLTGRVLAGAQARPDPVSSLMAAAPLGRPGWLPGPAVLGFLGCAAVVRRDAFLDAGGFSPRLGIYGEEELLALDLAAAGWGLAYVPELTVHHLPGPRTGHQLRDRLQRRNELLTALLRRPLPSAARKVGGALRTRVGRAALMLAARELPWVMRERRPIPGWLELAVRRLETSARSDDLAR